MVKAVGIDFGTVSSCVSAYVDGKVEIIPDNSGCRTIPSYVGFLKNQHSFGAAAKNQLHSNVNNTILDVKRLLGRQINDSTIENLMKYWSFNVVNIDGQLKIKIKYDDEDESKFLTPIEVCSMILWNMKQIAEEYLSREISYAVLTVPSCFNSIQRQLIEDAATIAGLNILRLISKSTSVGLVYNFEKRARNKQNILIFHLGGGSCDISVVVVKNNCIHVKSTYGDINLGGEDFVNRMMIHLIEEFKERSGKDVTQNKRSLNRLRNACECAKITLSMTTETMIEIDSFCDNIDFYTKITRGWFELICEDLFQTAVEHVKCALMNAKVDVKLIDKVLLVGGSTRIPKLIDILQRHFGREVLSNEMNADEASCCGAAIQAAILTGDKSNEIKSHLLHDVVPFSIGIKTSGEVWKEIVKINSTIPTKSAVAYPKKILPKDGSVIYLRIFGKVHGMRADDHLIGEFRILDKFLKLNDESQIEIMLDIDANMAINVTATSKESGETVTFKITNENKYVSEAEMDRMIRDAKIYREQAKIRHENIQAKNLLEQCCYDMREQIANATTVSHSDRQRVDTEVTSILSWLETAELITKNEYEMKLNQLKQQCSLIVDSSNHQKDAEPLPLKLRIRAVLLMAKFDCVTVVNEKLHEEFNEQIFDENVIKNIFDRFCQFGHVND